MFNPKVIYQLNLNQLCRHVINEKRNVIYIGKALYFSIIYINFLFLKFDF